MMENGADAVTFRGDCPSLSVAAEGVETLAAAQALTALDCDEHRGYCFSSPIPLPGLITYAENSEQTGEERWVAGWA